DRDGRLHRGRAARVDLEAFASPGRTDGALADLSLRGRLTARTRALRSRFLRVGDGVLIGLATGLLIWVAMWRAGVRPRPARESLAFVALGLALSLLLRVLGIFKPITTVV